MEENGVQKEGAQEHGDGKLGTSIPNREKAKEEVLVYSKKNRRIYTISTDLTIWGHSSFT